MGGRMKIETAEDLEVYKIAFQLSMEIFHITKGFPAEEKYALTSQIRRSSRSVCLNLREAWAKRRYEAHFISKLSDCDGENSETDSSLDFALACGYIAGDTHAVLTERCAEIGRMLGKMIQKSATICMNESPPDYGPPTSDLRPPTSDLRPPTSDLRPLTA